jgi:hypothetical protein
MKGKSQTQLLDGIADARLDVDPAKQTISM